MGPILGRPEARLILRHDRADADCLVDETDWPSIVTFFDGDSAGTLIRQRWVLTAAHTVAHLPQPPHPECRPPDQISRVVVHPGCVAMPPAPTVDLALAELDPPAAGVRS